MADGWQAATGVSAGKLNLHIVEVPAQETETIVRNRQTGKALFFRQREEFLAKYLNVPQENSRMQGAKWRVWRTIKSLSSPSTLANDYEVVTEQRGSDNFADAREAMCPYYGLYGSFPAGITCWIDWHEQYGTFTPRKNITYNQCAHHPNGSPNVPALQA